MAREDLHGFVQNLCRRLGAHGAGASDAELLSRWVAGRDEAAFELLLRRHAPLVLGVCRRLLHRPQDVEDAFQAAFLLLVRKAASIRRGQSVGSWLYKVAYRVALRARAGQKAIAAPALPDLETLPAPPDDELLWRDLRPVLDDEVSRLPERYRTAFILCHLQGLTNQEAADVLGCPLGTILSRLSWARRRLRSRLARRGLAVSLAGLVTLLAGRATPAAVPPELIQLTLTASLGSTASAAATTEATRPSLIAEGVSKTMFLNKLKLAAVAAVLLGLLAVGGSTAVRRTEAAPPPPTTPGDLPRAQEKKPARPEEGIRSVSTRLNGQILFLGTEIDPTKQTKEQMQRWRDEGKLIKVRIAFLATVATKEDKVQKVPVFRTKGDDRPWRRWTEEENPEPNQMKLVVEEKTFLRLRKGTQVRDGQLLGIIDPALSIADVQIKIAKLDVSAAELLTSTKTKEEARQRYNRLIDLRAKGTVSAEELTAGQLTLERYVEEEKAKFQNVNVARQELKQANITLSLYELRTSGDGVIKEILKHKGEHVKQGDVVIRIRQAGW